MINRYPFIVFMPNKPDKFGMKFWVLAEVKSKYVCNLLPHLGALKKKRNGKTLAEDVAMRLTDCLQRNRGYNITTDNFLPVYKLLGKEITVVKTVRGNCKGLPKEIIGSSKERFCSKFFYNANKNCLLVN